MESGRSESTSRGFVVRAYDDVEQLSREAAGVVCRAVRENPDLLLCAATGGSPTRTYALMVEEHRRDPALFARVRVIKLDEWAGVPMDHPGTCETYLQEKLVGPLGITPDRYISFRNDAEPISECQRIERVLATAGPIDLCILGLGLNGHLALNEPADALTPGPHYAELSPSSQQHPMIRNSAVPVTHGLTLGMADILRSRQILTLIHGANKAAPLAQLLNKSVTTRFPASFLHLHPKVMCLGDRDAMGSGSYSTG